jgi:hypothetical protein
LASDAWWITVLVPFQDRTTGFLFFIGASLPTAIYLFLGLLVLSIRMSPIVLQRAGKRVVYIVTTDSKPVFSQLGTLLGVVAGLLTAVSELLTHM